jgi:serine/threonine-protein kinase
VSQRRAAFEKQLGGRYRFDRLLGRGGMGEVWSAYDKKVDRPVAIKILAAELSDDADFAERFQHECKTVAKFSHPRIVSIFDAGVFPSDGRLYMIMELLRGKTLRAMLDEERAGGTKIDTVSAAFYAFEMLDGLATAHGEGIIHRDIKPENMIVDAQGHLKLVDFGVAKAIERTGRRLESLLGTGRPIRTKESMLLGTPRYMSPELIQGLPIDHRADLYAVGVILVRMLTKRDPYDIDPHDEVAVLRAHVEQEPVLDRDANPECPELVWSVALTLLAKDPDERFPDAEAAIDALWPFLRRSVPEHPIAKTLHHEHREVAYRHAFESRSEVSVRPPAEPAPSTHAEEGEVAEGGDARRPTMELASGFVAPSPCSPSALAARADTTRPIGAVLGATGPYPLARPLADVTKPIPAGVLPPPMRAPYPLARPAVPTLAGDAEPASSRPRTPAERQKDRQLMLYGAVLGLAAALVAVVITLVLLLRVPPPVTVSSAGAATAQSPGTATAEPPRAALSETATAEPTSSASPAPTSQPSATAPVSTTATAAATQARRPLPSPRQAPPPAPVLHVLPQPATPLPDPPQHVLPQPARSAPAPTSRPNDHSPPESGPIFR